MKRQSISKSGNAAVGRPTKYSAALLEKAQHYLDNYEEYEEVIPSAVGLALVLDITRTTLYDWAKDENKKVFSNILDNINKKQEQILLKNGLTNQFNSNITKLARISHSRRHNMDYARDVEHKPDEDLQAG